jgi:hypothetical protein
VKAVTIIEINVKYVRVTIYSELNATNKVTLRDIIHLENCSLTSFSEVQEAQYNLTTPKNISTGLTYGEISCEWEIMGLPQKILLSGFALTYISNMDLNSFKHNMKN